MDEPGLRNRLPESGITAPAIIFNKEDLPEPFRPTRQILSPTRTDKFTF